MGPDLGVALAALPFLALLVLDSASAFLALADKASICPVLTAVVVTARDLRGVTFFFFSSFEVGGFEPVTTASAAVFADLDLGSETSLFLDFVAILVTILLASLFASWSSRELGTNADDRVGREDVAVAVMTLAVVGRPLFADGESGSESGSALRFIGGILFAWGCVSVRCDVGYGLQDVGIVVVMVVAW